MGSASHILHCRPLCAFSITHLPSSLRYLELAHPTKFCILFVNISLCLAKFYLLKRLGIQCCQWIFSTFNPGIDTEDDQ